MYQIMEHPADVGLSVQSASLEGLLAEAAQGLNRILLENPEDIRPEKKKIFHLHGSDHSNLLQDWLSELLFEFQGRKMLYFQFTVRINDESVIIEAAGEPFNPQRHRPDREVKAVTYHGLTAQQSVRGWSAQALLDI